MKMAKDKGRICSVVIVWSVGRKRGADWTTEVFENFEEAAKAIRSLHPVDRKTVTILGTVPAIKIGDELLQVEELDNLRVRELFVEDSELEALKSEDYAFDLDAYDGIVEKYGAIELD